MAYRAIGLSCLALTAFLLLLEFPVCSSSQPWTYEKPCLSMPWSPLVSTKITAKPSTLVSVEDYDLLIVVVPPNSTNETCLEGMEAWVNKKYQNVLGEMLENKIKKSVMRAKVKTDDGSVVTKRFLLYELGSDDDVFAQGRKLGHQVASTLKSEKGIEHCAIFLPASLVTNTSSILSEATTSVLSGLYTDNRFKGKLREDKKQVEGIDFVVEPTPDPAEDDSVLSLAVRRGHVLAEGIYLCKDIVNAPHNTLNSIGLADTAKRIVAGSGGRLTLQILDYRECEKRGMGSFLGVARGSETQPQFLHLTYRPRNSGNRPITKLGIVGKGLLMDTGGYNIKTSMMELMKFDCGGAAAVLGAAKVIASLEPQGVEVHFVVAACENMINERAMVPGDILTASNGKTIEVINTDAEGRLTLADALVFVDKEVGCDKIVELSTLTGAALGALGTSMAALFCDDPDLVSQLQDAAKKTGDKVWRMPLEKDYSDQIKSKIADLRNIAATRFGGAIHAGLFLQHFVDEAKPFAHIDVAGPVWSFKQGTSTGYGVKLLADFVCQQSQE